MARPAAMSVVEERMVCVVSEWECRRRVWPPETRRVRKGKVGVIMGGVKGVVDGGGEGVRAEMRRGVRAWACMWFIPIRGIPQATERPLAVSRPVLRQANMPGPRVTLMKVGFWRRVHWFLFVRTGIVGEGWGRGGDGDVGDGDGDRGRLCRDLAIRVVRFFWWDRREATGWMPRNRLLSAVIFSLKWRVAVAVVVVLAVGAGEVDPS